MNDSADIAAAGARQVRRRAHLAQVLILAVLIAGTVYVADTVVGGSLFHHPYHLTVELDQAAGLHKGSVVTYRGQRIGEVTDVRLSGRTTGARVVADLSVDKGVEVPRNSTLKVLDLSAVGEQYLDVQPASASGPWYADGDTVPLARTTTPVSVPQVLVDAQGLMRHLDVGDVRTIARETQRVFGGSDVDLRALSIDLESAFAMLRRLEPTLTHVVRTAAIPLTTGFVLSPALRRISSDLDRVTAALRAATPAIRRTVVNATDLLPRLSRWWRGNRVTLISLLDRALPVSVMSARHLRGLDTWLDWAPLQAVAMAGSTRGGSGRVLLVPRILKNCVYSPMRQRDLYDLSRRAPLLDERCTNPPTGTQARGSANVPRQ
ncbi:MAG TPA: MlaD family protein [Nocardioides sp.]|nr:MlaD family protein [Nocardioides sp.]